MTLQEIEAVIHNQNSLNGIKVTYMKSNKNGNKTIFCECLPASFTDVMGRRKIYIGWYRYPVYEDLRVLKYFKCQQFYHKGSVCV